MRISNQLLLEHPPGQRLGCVMWQHGHPPLQDNRAMVVLVIADMHGATTLSLAGIQHRPVHTHPVEPLPAILGQQSRMNVQDTTSKLRGYPPERRETRHAYQINSGLEQGSGDRRVKSLLIKPPAIRNYTRNPSLPGPLQPVSRRLGADHHANGCRQLLASAQRMQILKRSPAAGEQNA